MNSSPGSRWRKKSRLPACRFSSRRKAGSFPSTSYAVGKNLTVPTLHWGRVAAALTHLDIRIDDLPEEPSPLSRRELSFAAASRPERPGSSPGTQERSILYTNSTRLSTAHQAERQGRILPSYVGKSRSHMLAGFGEPAAVCMAGDAYHRHVCFGQSHCRRRQVHFVCRPTVNVLQCSTGGGWTTCISTF
jgi:hypothetical protein